MTWTTRGGLTAEELQLAMVQIWKNVLPPPCSHETLMTNTDPPLCIQCLQVVR